VRLQGTLRLLVVTGETGLPPGTPVQAAGRKAFRHYLPEWGGG
jgi:hypothetical protein